jgi:uncharacterized protein (TIGR03435 family)
MKKITALLLILGLAACGKPVDRPAVAKKGELAPQIALEKIVKGDLKPMKGWEDLKGKAVVLEFWGPGCEPCVDNIPHLNDLAEKFKDKPVVFISAARDSEADIKKFLETHAMGGSVAAEAADAFKKFRVFGIPHTVLIDKDSRVAAFSYPSRVTEAVIEDLLAGKPLQGDKPMAEEETAGDAKAVSYFSLGTPGSELNLSFGGSDFSADGMTLSYILEKAMRDTHGVEYFEVPEDLKNRKFKLTARVAPVQGADDGQRLRDLIVAGLNGALPVKISVQSRKKTVYLLKKNGALKPALALSSRKGGGSKTGRGSVEMTAGSMADLADEIEGWVGAPVLDETGLNGRYDYALEVKDLTPKAVSAALTEKFGLKLAEAKREVEITEVRLPAAGGVNIR